MKSEESLTGERIAAKQSPRPLWEREEFLNERSEFRNSGEGADK